MHKLSAEENTIIIKKLKAGDKSTFQQIYTHYYPQLKAIANKFNSEWYTPEDFVQDTFIRLYRKRHLLKEDKPFDTQIKIMCKNQIINILNKENIKIDTNLDVQSDYYVLQTEHNDSNDVMEFKIAQIYHLIDELPPKQKEIFELHKLRNYSYEEIEVMTGLSPKTIANHIYLAKKFIRENFKN